MTYNPTAPESGNNFRQVAQFLTRPAVRIIGGLATLGVGYFTGVPLAAAAGSYVLGDIFASWINQSRAQSRIEKGLGIQTPEQGSQSGFHWLRFGLGSIMAASGLVNGKVVDLAMGSFIAGEALRSKFGGGYDRTRLTQSTPAPH